MTQQATIQHGSEKQHWFRGVFYRKDGGKQTFQTKKVTGVCVVSVAVIATYLIFQGSPQQIRKSKISAPDGSSQNGVDIPVISLSDSQAASKQGSSTKAGQRKPIKYTAPQVVSRPRLPVPPGSMVRAKLITGASNGSVRAEILEGLTVKGETVIDPGTVISGTGTSSEDRLVIQFDQLAFKDGAIQSIRAQALDPDDKIAGVKGSTVGNKTLQLAGSLGLNFIGGFSEGLQDTEVKGGVAFRPSTIKNALLNGAAHTAIEESREMMSSLKNSRPLIEIEAGKEVVIAFQ